MSRALESESKSHTAGVADLPIATNVRLVHSSECWPTAVELEQDEEDH